MERPVRARRRELGRHRRVKWLLVPGLLWLLVLYVVPTISVLSMSLQEGSLERGYRLTWRWRTYAEVLSRYDAQLIRSVAYALVVTALCLVISYPLAYAIALHGGRYRNTLLFLVIMPFFVSLIIRTLSWKFVLADQGLLLGALKDVGMTSSLRILNTPGAVIAGLVYNYLPFMILPLYVALERIDGGVREASRDLYGAPLQTLLRVTVPLSIPGIVAGVLLTLVPVVGDFINAELLGGAGQTMIGNVIERQYLVANDYPVAAALALLLMAALLVTVVVSARFRRVQEFVA